MDTAVPAAPLAEPGSRLASRPASHVDPRPSGSASSVPEAGPGGPAAPPSAPASAVQEPVAGVRRGTNPPTPSNGGPASSRASAAQPPPAAAATDAGPPAQASQRGASPGEQSRTSRRSQHAPPSARPSARPSASEPAPSPPQSTAAASQSGVPAVAHSSAPSVHDPPSSVPAEAQPVARDAETRETVWPVAQGPTITDDDAPDAPDAVDAVGRPPAAAPAALPPATASPPPSVAGRTASTAAPEAVAVPAAPAAGDAEFMALVARLRAHYGDAEAGPRLDDLAPAEIAELVSCLHAEMCQSAGYDEPPPQPPSPGRSPARSPRGGPAEQRGLSEAFGVTHRSVSGSAAGGVVDGLRVPSGSVPGETGTAAASREKTAEGEEAAAEGEAGPPLPPPQGQKLGVFGRLFGCCQSSAVAVRGAAERSPLHRGTVIRPPPANAGRGAAPPGTLRDAMQMLRHGAVSVVKFSNAGGAPAWRWVRVVNVAEPEAGVVDRLRGRRPGAAARSGAGEPPMLLPHLCWGVCRAAHGGGAAAEAASGLQALEEEALLQSRVSAFGAAEDDESFRHSTAGASMRLAGGGPRGRTFTSLAGGTVPSAANGGQRMFAADASGRLPLPDLVAVRQGPSRSLRRDVHGSVVGPDQRPIDPARCCSLLFNGRSVDFAFPTVADCDEWVAALALVVERNERVLGVAQSVGSVRLAPTATMPPAGGGGGAIDRLPSVDIPRVESVWIPDRRGSAASSGAGRQPVADNSRSLMVSRLSAGSGAARPLGGGSALGGSIGRPGGTLSYSGGGGRPVGALGYSSGPAGAAASSFRPSAITADLAGASALSGLQYSTGPGLSRVY